MEVRAEAGRQVKMLLLPSMGEQHWLRPEGGGVGGKKCGFQGTFEGGA